MAAMIRMAEEDLNALRAAAATLEYPGLAARLGNIAGKPIELLGRALPEAASEAVAGATTKALRAALAVALRTMEKEPKAPSRLLHKALAAASGAVGGGFGLAALPVELPISTIIMLRSIGDIARSEGEDLADPESALACLQVFAARWRGECRRERVFRCPRAARQIGRGGRALHSRTRGVRGGRTSPGSVHCPNRIPLWRGGDAEARSASRAGSVLSESRKRI
jgi:hypothetical protein